MPITGIRFARRAASAVVMIAMGLSLLACGDAATKKQSSDQSSKEKPRSALTQNSAERPQLSPPPPPAQAIEVEQAIPAPKSFGFEIIQEYSHDNAAYTQGLQFIDGELFESTGQWGESSLRRVLLESGKVVQQRDLPMRYFGEGLTLVNDRIYQLTWRSGMAFVYDRTSFEPLDTLRYAGEGWGLSYDGSHLIMSNGSAQLLFCDPADMSVKRSITVHDSDGPMKNLNELEYIKGEVWANVYTTDLIVRIDPANGAITGVIDLSGLFKSADDPFGKAEVLNGIAWDSEQDRLFLTGKYWPKLFHVRLVER